MNKMNEIFGKLIMPLLVPVLVGIGSSGLTVMITTARLEERVTHLERKTDEHIRSASDLGKTDNDFERRVSKLEAINEATQRSLAEISADVKSILKSQRFTK